MKIFAIADLHLSFGVKNKSMDLFGPQWKEFENKIKKHWEENVSSDDLVLIPGDISWALKLEQAIPDLEWIDALPGKKLLLKGNHDYWWPSLTKLKKALPPSIDILQNNVYTIDSIAIAGSRLWDSTEYSFDQLIDYVPNPKEKEKTFSQEESERVFSRELKRLENSLEQIPNGATVRIAMTHYPPIDAELSNSKTSKLFEKHLIQHVVFGHLHNIKKGLKLFGKANDGIDYHLVSCDYLDFLPKLICSI